MARRRRSGMSQVSGERYPRSDRSTRSRRRRISSVITSYSIHYTKLYDPREGEIGRKESRKLSPGFRRGATADQGDRVRVRVPCPFPIEDQRSVGNLSQRFRVAVGTEHQNADPGSITMLQDPIRCLPSYNFV